jgi:hypothetical protein
MKKISYSKGNKKLKNIHNISLPPIKTCIKASCNQYCYAMKAYRLHPNVKKSWDINLEICNFDQNDYFDQIYKNILKFKPAYFRFHVSGDIPNQNYLDEIAILAQKTPSTNYLVYTKKYQFDYSICYGIDNLTVIFSCCTGTKKPKQKKGVKGFYWVNDGIETRIPADAIQCHGFCSDCLKCWNIDKQGTNHIFNNKH